MWVNSSNPCPLFHRGFQITFTERNFLFGLKYSVAMVKLNVASELLMVVNSSINFVVYVVFGRRFRQILRETFACPSFVRLLKSRGPAAPTAVTHDLPGPVAASPALEAEVKGHGVVCGGYHQKRLQYHHNCVHAHAAVGGSKGMYRRTAGLPDGVG